MKRTRYKTQHLATFIFMAAFLIGARVYAQAPQGETFSSQRGQQSQAQQATVQQTPTAPLSASASAAATSAPAAVNAADASGRAQETPLTLQAALKFRDPFKKPDLKMASQDEGGQIPELERFSVDQLKLVGVITGTQKNKAMIVTPDNRMHIVNERDRIGNRKGFVKKIVQGKVQIEEKIINILGEEERIDTALEFSEKDKQKL